MTDAKQSEHPQTNQPGNTDDVVANDANTTEQPEGKKHHRPLRSYVIRASRLTAAQKEALANYWSKYVIEDTSSPLDVQSTFGREAPLVVEIGFGMGDSLAMMAKANPHLNYIGIEVHKPGVGKLLHAIEAEQISNLRIYCHDAVEILQNCIADHSLAGVQIFFPDPWHKKKHHKRRLVQPAFIEKLKSKLAPGGFIHLATDWQHYAEQMMEVMESAHGFHNTAGQNQYAQDTGRPETKFERRGQRLGHGVWDLLFSVEPPKG
ncbi:tRNA (guanosine(46)-N7)-methyltransferase TrmB [Pseudohongiella nitratireducens]|uniref:tRNA (guanosine(46)-N7)-methyltransferase TrmB n=1 Tax=Pseudohongiella nitratireducens TaxID=1768907 RepID=UPI0030EE9330|tara:strand:- start:385 stop:1173 length:789 start_codon:yes stop_codon:yes gene_type:complete